MTPKTSQLDNGLRIVTAEMPGSYSVSVLIAVGVGSRHEKFDVNGGVSHFLEHLLFKGTKKWPTTKDIAEAVDGVGGMNNAYTSNELTSYFIKLPKKHAGLALDILADMIQNPLLDAAEVDRERGVIVEEMHVYQDDPARHIHDLVPGLLWPKDPLGQEIIGPESVIQKVPRDVIADYQKLHYSPDNMVVSFAGNIKHDWVVTEIEKVMGGMKRRQTPRLAKLKSDLSDNLTLGVTKDTNQAHLAIGAHGYPYNHDKDIAATVLANLLGSGMSSRLFIQVRERQGLAYTVYADYSNFVDTGLFEIYAGVNLDKTLQALEAILAEVDKIRNEPPGEEELTKVKNKLSGGLQMGLENTMNLADRFATRLLLTGKVRSVEETISLIEQIKPEDVTAVAKEMLDPKKLRLVAIAPDPSDIQRKFEQLVGGK